MNSKKAPNLSLEGKRPSFFLLGLMAAGAIVLCAFEWRSPHSEYSFGCPTWEDPLPTETQFFHPNFKAEKPPEIPKKQNTPKSPRRVIDSFRYSDIPNMSAAPVTSKILVNNTQTNLSSRGLATNPTLPGAEIMPEFPGGQAALSAYLSGKISYTSRARDAHIQGKVFVEFTVNRYGRIEDVKLIRGLDPDLDRQAIEAVVSMPNWIPGRHNGVPVSVRFVMPVSFTLKK